MKRCELCQRMGTEENGVYTVNMEVLCAECMEILAIASEADRLIERDEDEQG